MSCLFCDIISRKIPGEIVYEDEQVLAFHDIHPQAPVHILIIPKEHVATLNDLTSDTASMMGSLFLTAKTLAKQFDIADAGYRVVSNCNPGAGQTVFHIHLHLLGGRPLHWPPG